MKLLLTLLLLGWNVYLVRSISKFCIVSKLFLISQAKAIGLMSMNRQLAANFNPYFNDRAFDRANRPGIDYRPTGRNPQPCKFPALIVFSMS
jgi:hypothetical protein